MTKPYTCFPFKFHVDTKVCFIAVNIYINNTIMLPLRLLLLLLLQTMCVSVATLTTYKWW